MTTSNPDPSNAAASIQNGLDWTAKLPDEAELEKLANQFFSALPCDGSGKGLTWLADAPSTNPAETLSDFGQPVTANRFGLLSETELQKLMVPANPLVAQHSASVLPDWSAPQANLGGLQDIINSQDFGLPGAAGLKQLLAEPARACSQADQAGQSGYYFLDDQATTKRLADIPLLKFAHPAFDVNAVRRDFPILKEKVNGHPLVWFDNAATTQKPQSVIDRISYFYQHENSNIHRAAHELAARSTDAYENARKTVARFLNASSPDEIVFVRGTTEGINLVAQSWGRQYIGKGDEILITWLEHHANIVPWQQLCAETGAVLKVAPVDNDGQVLLNEYQKLLTPKTKLVAFTQVSNALGTVTPAQIMIDLAHRVGAKVLLDAAQSVSHLAADVQALDCDWLVFSGHKIFAPTGIGALYGKPALLEAMQPWQGGGNMIDDVSFEKTTYQPAPAKFEAGTGNIADAVGLGAALEYVENLGIANIAEYEHALLAYAMEALRSIPGLRLIGTATDKTSVLSFVLAGHSNQDVGIALNKVGIAVRTGHHCAQPILRRFGLESTVRPSLAFYNTHDEVDLLVDTVRQLQASNLTIV